MGKTAQENGRFTINHTSQHVSRHLAQDRGANQRGLLPTPRPGAPRPTLLVQFTLQRAHPFTQQRHTEPTSRRGPEQKANSHEPENVRFLSSQWEKSSGVKMNRDEVRRSLSMGCGPAHPGPAYPALQRVVLGFCSLVHETERSSEGSVGLNAFLFLKAAQTMVARTTSADQIGPSGRSTYGPFLDILHQTDGRAHPPPPAHRWGSCPVTRGPRGLTQQVPHTPSLSLSSLLSP